LLARLQHLVGAKREHRVSAPARRVAERVREERLAYANGPDDGDVFMRVDEPQRDDPVPERLIEVYLRGCIPALQLHVGIEVTALDSGSAGRSGGRSDPRAFMSMVTAPKWREPASESGQW